MLIKTNVVELLHNSLPLKRTTNFHCTLNVARLMNSFYCKLTEKVQPRTEITSILYLLDVKGLGEG